MRRLVVPLLCALLVLGGQPAAAQGGERCFPETGQCISGRFRDYWQQNGGQDLFGFPITPMRNEANRDTGQSFLTQWFERNRFELHPDNKPPYDVLLGRLGDDLLRQRGLDWQSAAGEAGPRPGCLWFDATRRNVCDQGNGLGFKTYWQAHGLRDPALNAFDRSLALFGLPLTAPRMETNVAGDAVLTQWFERARFEWHPDKPDAFKVLLGLLGNEVLFNTRPERAVSLARTDRDGALARTTPLAASPFPGTIDELRGAQLDVLVGYLAPGRAVGVGRTQLRAGGTYGVVMRHGAIVFVDGRDGKDLDPGLAAEMRAMPREVSPPETVMIASGVCYSWRRVQVCTRPSLVDDLLTGDERAALRSTTTAAVDRLTRAGKLAPGEAIDIDGSLPDVEGGQTADAPRASLIAAPSRRDLPDPARLPASGVLVGVMTVSLAVATRTSQIPPATYAVTILPVAGTWRARLDSADGPSMMVPVDFRPVLGQIPNTPRPLAVVLDPLCFLDWCLPSQFE